MDVSAKHENTLGKLRFPLPCNLKLTYLSTCCQMALISAYNLLTVPNMPKKPHLVTPRLT